MIGKKYKKWAEADVKAWEKENEKALAYIDPLTKKRVLKGQLEGKREKTLIKVKKSFARLK